MRFLSVCSGIEAASVAWEPLGWRPLAFAEIEAFPRAVLAYHYSDTPCHGDFTALREQDWIVDADLLVGGTPCQAFSVAGLRQSLADDRGNLRWSSSALPTQSTIFDALLDASPHSSCGKTSLESYPSRTTPSAPSWAAWSEVMNPSFRTGDGLTRVWSLDPKEWPHGGFWTPSSSAWLREGGGSSCSLSEVLERGDVPTRFYLSSTACKGILRRAEKRGKQLPPSLAAALEAAASGRTSTVMGG
jgi:hypothetical protein